MSNPTYSDFKNASPEELKKTYKLDSRQLEQAHRRVLDGAKKPDLDREYKKLYEGNRK